MPDFKLNDVLYDIPDNLVDQFKLDNPDAIEQPIKKSIRKQTRQNDLLGKVLPPQKEEKPSATVEEPVALEPTITDSTLAPTSLEFPKVKTGVDIEAETFLPSATPSFDENKLYSDFESISVSEEEIDTIKSSYPEEEVDYQAELLKRRKQEYFVEDLDTGAKDALAQLSNKKIQDEKVRIEAITNEYKSIEPEIYKISGQLQLMQDAAASGRRIDEKQYLGKLIYAKSLKFRADSMRDDILDSNASTVTSMEAISAAQKDYSALNLLDIAGQDAALNIGLQIAKSADYLGAEGTKFSFFGDLLDAKKYLQDKREKYTPTPAGLVNPFKDPKQFADFFVESIAQGVPSVTLAVGAGYMSLPLFYMMGSGGKFGEFGLSEREAKKNIPLLKEKLKTEKDITEISKIKNKLNSYYNILNTSEIEKALTATGYGGAEAAGELLTLKFLKGLSKTFNYIPGQTVNQSIKALVAKQTEGFITELQSGAITSILQNSIDITRSKIGTLENAPALFDGVAQDAVAEGFAGLLLPTGGGFVNIRKTIIDQAATVEERQKMVSLSKEIDDLSKELQTNESLSENERIAISNKIKQKVKQQAFNVDLINKKISNLNGEQIKKVFELAADEQNIYNRWLKIAYDPNIPLETKNKFKKDFETEFNKKRKEKFDILNARYTKTQEFRNQKGVIIGEIIAEGGDVDSSIKAAEMILKNSGINLVVGENEMDLSEKIDNLFSSDIKLQSSKSAILNNNGAIYNDGNTIFINKSGILKNVAGGNIEAARTVRHEVLHAVLATVDNNTLQNAANNVLSYLDVAVSENKISKTTYDNIKNRLKEKYESDLNKVLNNPKSTNEAKEAAIRIYNEEVITTLNDEIDNISVEENKTFFQKLKDDINSIIPIFSSAKNIELKTPDEVISFLKRYNDSFAKKSLSIKGSLTEGVDVKFSKSESSNKVQRIYEEQGIGGAMDIINEFQPIVNKLVNKYRDVPGFDYQILKDEIETGKRGILDMIMDYTPEKAKGAPLAGYINKFLASRMIEVANRNLDTEFTLDVTEAKGVADVSTVETIIEEKETAITEEAKKVTLSEGLDTSIEVNGVTLKETVNKSLEKAVALSVKKYNEEISKNRTVTPFIQSIKEGLAKDLRKPIKAFINSYPGGYEKFLQDNRGFILDNFTTTYLSKHPLFKKGIQKSSGGIKSIDAEGKAIFNANFISPTQIEKNKFDWVDENGKKLKIDRDSAAGRGLTSGPEIMRRDPQIKNKITENEFVDYHFQDGPRRTKKKQNPEDAIAMQIASELGFEYLKQDFSNKGPIFQKFSDVGNLLDVVIPDTADVQVIKDIDRGVIKFSMNTKGDGTWAPDLINPLSNNKFYHFNVADQFFRISLFENDDYDYKALEDIEGIAENIFINDPKSMAASFLNIEEDSFEITGKTGAKDSVKVFSIVANSLLDIIKKDNLNSISFSAKEKNRQSLYQAMVLKFQKELGWESYSFPAEGEMAFVVYNPELIRQPVKNIDPSTIKFSLNTKNKYKVDAKTLLYDEKAFNKFKNKFIKDDEIYQDFIGNIGWLSSVRPSNVIDYTKLPGYDNLKKDEKNKLKEKIDIITDAIKAYKPKNNINILRKEGWESYKNTAKVFGTTVKEIEKNIKNGNIFKYTKLYQRVYDDMWDKYFDILQAHPEMIDFLEFTLQLSNNDTSHWHRLGAIFKGYDPTAQKVYLTKKDGTPLKNIYGYQKTRIFEYEHAFPNQEQWKRVLNKAKYFAKKNNKEAFKKYLQETKKDYVMLALAYTDARKIDKGKLAKKMPSGSKTWWNRYFNKIIAAIDGGILPSNISFINYSDTKAEIKGTLADELNINSDGTIRASKSLNRGFNEILAQSTGIKWTQKFSPVEARAMGKGKGKRKFFIPYSADDFVGLLYTTLASGKTGEEQMQWYEENLLRPFSRGIQQYEAAKQNALRQWNIIKKEAKKEVPGGLTKRNETGLTNQDAVRIYIWKQQGMGIPGISAKLITENIKIVKANPKLIEFANRLMSLNPEGYPEPSNSWDAGDITTDIVSYINGVKRSEFLEPWKNNVEKIFSEDNKNKLRALYGDAYLDALEDILHRMKTGRNRRMGISKIEQRFMDWTNNSVGAIMFFNARSAVLQTLSTVNFINFTDNNPINAAKAFANLPQYWEDFSTLFNSDFLKQRRSGLQTDINADEIARAAKGAENTARAALSAILKFGFTPTQIADSFAIASGGATFYRNRINKYKKEGIGDLEAKQKAFTDFQEIAEETQQSARPDRISLQQASSLGRIILAFGNTPMQYARLTKKAALDLINGRGDWKTNISKIMYYSVIQNIIFSALQQGLFALLFSDEEEDKEKERYYKLGNGILDGFLRGTGVYGAAASTVKNMILKIIEESKKSRPDYTKVAIESTSLSPPINSKLRKLMAAGRTFTYKQSKEKVYTEGFSLENPAFLAAGQVISAATNLPADRVVLKADHIKTAIEPETELWQSIALALGWSEWDLGMIKKQTKKESTGRRRRSRSRTRTRTRTRN